MDNKNCELNDCHMTPYKSIHSKTAVDTLIYSKTVVDASVCLSSVSGKRKHEEVVQIYAKRTNTEPNVGFDRYSFENINFVSRAYGIFNEYPPGILNTAFCGMILWELNPHHMLNKFRLNQYHCIRSGVIVQNSTAYVFTPICNDDIHSHLKILIRNKVLKNNTPPSKAATMLRKYVRYNSQNTIIPSINEIQNSLFSMLGLSENNYIDDKTSYYTLLHRLYLLIFMIHYKMPLQRRNLPGGRNKSTNTQETKKRGWFSYLKPIEQELLNSPYVQLSSSQIPEDSINGVLRLDNMDYLTLSQIHIQNSTMFRDGSMDNIRFQYKILKFQRNYRSRINQTAVHDTNISETSVQTITAVPSIKDLKSKVCTSAMQTYKMDHSSINKTWNQMFHDIIELCELEEEFNLESLPMCYEPGASCSHIFHIDMEKTINVSLQLTLLEQSKQQTTSITKSREEAAKFINLIVKHNPIWDMGLQFLSVQKDSDKLFINVKNQAKGYTKKCVCPCSHMLRKWHSSRSFSQFSTFVECDSYIFSNPMELV